MDEVDEQRDAEKVTDLKGPQSNQPAIPLATIVVVPRDRFGVAVESLLSVIEDTPAPYNLVYIDAGSPAEVAKQLLAICEANDFRYVRLEGYVSPNTARNIGLRFVVTPYTVLMDNDVVVSPGWLEALVACAQETGAEVVAPLTCQGLPLHSEIHQAGGEFAADHRAFLTSPADARRITDINIKQGEKVTGANLVRGETQCCEFHCVLVRSDTFERFGELDENLLASKDHLDFCMTVWAGGGRVLFEPAAVVTFLFPNGSRPLSKDDWAFFALRWSPSWQRASLDHFQKKWSLHEDPYFAWRRSKDMLQWRISEGIAKPIVKKLPLLTRSYRVKTAAVRVVTFFLRRWSDTLVKRHGTLTQRAAPSDAVSAQVDAWV